MIEWLIQSLIKIVLDAGAGALDKIIQAFEFDLTLFSARLPIVADSYALFQAFGVGLVLLFILWQAFKALGAPLGIESEEPVKILFKGVLAIFFIYNAQTIFNIGFTTLRPVYDAISQLGQPTPLVPTEDGTLPPGWGVGLHERLESARPIGSMFGDIASTLTALGLVELILYAFVLIFVMWQLLKMSLEIIERYVLLGIIAVTSPLGFSTMTTKATSNIFSAWSRMAIGQFIIYLLNYWSFKLIINGMRYVGTFDASNDVGNQALINLLFIWALAKVAQKLDEYLGKLGIEVGNVGGSLAEELMIARTMIGVGGKVAGLGGKKSGAMGAALQSSAAGGNAVAKSSGLLSKAISYSPIGLAAKGVGAAAGGIMSFARNVGSSDAGRAFKDAKIASEKGRTAQGLKNSTTKGRLTNFAAGAGAFLATGAKYAVTRGIPNALNIPSLMGQRIASKINAPPGKDGLPLAKNNYSKDLSKAANNRHLAAHTLGNLQKATIDPSVVKPLFKGLSSGDNIGGLTYDMLENEDVRFSAYNGGISWSLDTPLTKDGVKGVHRTEGVIAVDGNNDASKHVANMRKTPGVSAEHYKYSGVSFSTATKTSFIPNKSANKPNPYAHNATREEFFNDSYQTSPSGASSNPNSTGPTMQSTPTGTATQSNPTGPTMQSNPTGTATQSNPTGHTIRPNQVGPNIKPPQ
mgnify:FL=1